MRLHFDAPWSTRLTVVGCLVSLVFVGAIWSGSVLAVAIVTAAVAIAGVLAVRGYVVEPGALVVLRTGWETRIDLAGLASAEADPDAMRWAWRTFGVGGPFAFVGRYRSGRLGPFTAYATDRDCAVVLRWPGRTVVVTPDAPDVFVTAVEAAAEADGLAA